MTSVTAASIVTGDCSTSFRASSLNFCHRAKALIKKCFVSALRCAEEHATSSLSHNTADSSGLRICAKIRLRNSAQAIAALATWSAAITQVQIAMVRKQL